MPGVSVSWTAPVIASGASGVVPGPSASPWGTVPNSAACSGPGAGGTGRPASFRLSGKSEPTSADITAPSTAVPSAPPTCRAVCCGPPATPDSSVGALQNVTENKPPVVKGGT